MHELYNRPDFSPVKEGAGFLIGPCRNGKRNNDNLMYSCVGVIDADSTLLPDGKVETGAPPIDDVHIALKSMNLTHFIYSTYSHGSGKGNRYRIIFPMVCTNKVELLASLTVVANLLQNNSNIPLALTKESHTWAQMWQLPRLSGPEAPYEVRFHIGYEINPKIALIHAGFYDEFGNPKPTTVPPPLRVAKQAGEDDEDDTRPSVIRMFNRIVNTLELLGGYGYTIESQQTIVDENGEPSLAYRLKKPGSNNQAGIVAFVDPFTRTDKGDACYRVYSHHTTDPLCNGHSNDAFACMMLIEGLSLNLALVAAAKVVQAEVDQYMAEQFPSLADKSFRVLNRCFAGSKVYFNSIDWNAFTMMTINSEPVPTQEKGPSGEKYVKFVPVPDYWKLARKRVTYSDLVFSPYPADEEHGFHYEDNGTLKFNTFHGWSSKPRKGEWPLLQQHLFNTICGKNQKEYEYLLDWFSHMFTKPKEKPGVALVIKGGKGWGKSSVFHRIKEAIGYNATVLSHSEQLVGKFNAHIRDSLLIIAEEAFFHGNKRDASALKHLITDQYTMTEAKGKDAKQSDSYCRIIMVTNDDLVVEATGDERRYFIPSVSDWSYRKDIVDGEKGHFFPALFAEMDNGGLEAFMHDMIQREATMTKIVNVPNTSGLAQQRIHALSGAASWLYRVLRDAHFETDDKIYNWTTVGLRVKEKDLLKAIKPELNQHERGRNYVFHILTKLQQLLGNNVQIVAGMVVFGPIEACRKSFLERSLVPADAFDEATHPLENFLHESNVTTFPSKTGTS